tara:strand:+ start:69 stop:353 length:285 start_codon:yes stop_codon:yes gene_type:complete
MDTTFDINKVDDERLNEPASYGQIRAISFKFSKNKPAKDKWAYQKQIVGCLYGFAKNGKLTFQEAHKLISTTKTLPKKYTDAIEQYLADNPEVS